MIEEKKGEIDEEGHKEKNGIGDRKETYRNT